MPLSYNEYRNYDVIISITLSWSFKTVLVIVLATFAQLWAKFLWEQLKRRKDLFWLKVSESLVHGCLAPSAWAEHHVSKQCVKEDAVHFLMAMNQTRAAYIMEDRKQSRAVIAATRTRYSTNDTPQWPTSLKKAPTFHSSTTSQ
jgi:hypothetical protein